MSHKLPFYQTAADLLKLVHDTGKNVKHVLYSEKRFQFMNIKALYALVFEALKRWKILEILINDSQILNEKSQNFCNSFNIWHLRILVTELCFGKRIINSDHVFVQTVLQYKEKFEKIMCRCDVQKLILDLPKAKFHCPAIRYIKVNTLKGGVDSVINTLNNEGWQQWETADSYEGYLEQLKELESKREYFVQDFHIPEVLAFPPGTELYWHDLYKSGSFYFMDKSSCLAPLLLRPHDHSTVLDMCAAPGLKTVHLANIVTSGKIYAVERDNNRFKSLQEIVSYSGAENVTIINNDVTKLEVEKYSDVEYILLDPSCSGSGMRNRQVSNKFQDTNNEKRLHQLAGFQLTLLRFALTRFPAAKRVVYSTCSLNVEENEEVIQAALNSKYHDFELASIRKHLPQWMNFGSEKFSFGSKCVYSLPDTDLTNGFFVAVFRRKKNKYCENENQSEIKAETTVKMDQKSPQTERKMHSKHTMNANELTYQDSNQILNNTTPSYSDKNKKEKYKSGLKFPIKRSFSETDIYNNCETNNSLSKTKKMIFSSDTKSVTNHGLKGNESLVKKNFVNQAISKSSNSTKLITASIKKRVRKSKLKRMMNINTKKDNKLVNSDDKRDQSSEKSKLKTQKKLKNKINSCNNEKDSKSVPSKAYRRRHRKVILNNLKMETNDNYECKMKMQSVKGKKALCS